MAGFKDATGKRWDLRITIGMLPALRTNGLNVVQALKNPEAFTQLDDPEALGRVLFLLCESQAEKSGISPEDFVNAIDGPAMFEALDGLMEAIADFSQRPTAAKEIKARLSATTQEMEAKAVETIKTMTFGSTDTAGSTVDLSASTPDR